MAKVIDYDDSNLQRLFDALTPKQRMVAMRRAFKREASYVRNIAISNMWGCLNAGRKIESGIRAIVFKRKAGFKVTIATKRANSKGNGERGYYISRKLRKKDATGKPVLIWAEEGTDPRYTKGRIKMGIWKSRKVHSTGRMRPYGFMKKTLDETQFTVTDHLRNEIIESVQTEAKKYGCS